MEVAGVAGGELEKRLAGADVPDAGIRRIGGGEFAAVGRKSQADANPIIARAFEIENGSAGLEVPQANAAKAGITRRWRRSGHWRQGRASLAAAAAEASIVIGQGEPARFLEAGGVPPENGLIDAGADHGLAIGGESDGGDGGEMAVEGGRSIAEVGVPPVQGVADGPHGKDAIVAWEGNGMEVRFGALIEVDAFAALDFPGLQGAREAEGRKDIAVGREAEPAGAAVTALAGEAAGFLAAGEIDEVESGAAADDGERLAVGGIGGVDDLAEALRSELELDLPGFLAGVEIPELESAWGIAVEAAARPD